MWLLIVILLILGTLFLLAEMFVVGGVVGFIGLVLLGLAVYLCFQYYSAMAGTLVLSLSILITITVLILVVKVIPRTGLRNGFILDDSTSRETGYHSDSNIEKNLEGKEGVAESYLRPAGIAMIENERYDVVSDGEYIEAHSNIRVLRVDGNRIVVERAR